MEDGWVQEYHDWVWWYNPPQGQNAKTETSSKRHHKVTT